MTVERAADAGVTVVAPATSTWEHSPADVLRLVVALAVTAAVLVVEWLFGDSLSKDTAELLRGLDTIPEPVIVAVQGLVRVAAVVLLVAGVVGAARHHRWRVLWTAVAAAAVAIAILTLTNAVAPHAARSVIEVNGWVIPDFPTAWSVAGSAAAMTAAAPWLSRRWRRAGWTVVVAVAIVRFVSTAISFETLRAFLLGWLVGAAAVVVFGGPNRRPSGSAIVAGLAQVGVPLRRLEQASLDARGSTPYFAETVDGARLFVKALGEDERSADLLFRLYRRALPRDLGDEKPFSTLRRAVEHEALVALTAKGFGIRTPGIVAFARADPNGFVLAYEAVDGRSLDRLDPAEVTDALLGAIWDQVVELRMHRIAHRDLRLANIFVAADGAIWMIDFGFSELAASDLLLANDVAELLASSSVQVGAERAVGCGASVAGPAVLRAALDRLQPWALSGATRTALKQRPDLLDELRRRVETAG